MSSAVADKTNLSFSCSCPHFVASVGFLSENDYQRLVDNPACDICGPGARGARADGDGASDLWLCLYPDCFMLGCSEGKDHSTKHQEKNPDHCVQMNIETRRIWCYKCNLEVGLNKSTKRFFIRSFLIMSFVSHYVGQD